MSFLCVLTLSTLGFKDCLLESGSKVFNSPRLDFASDTMTNEQKNETNKNIQVVFEINSENIHVFGKLWIKISK